MVFRAQVHVMKFQNAHMHLYGSKQSLKKDARKLYTKIELKKRYDKSVRYCAPHNESGIQQDKRFELKLIFMFEAYGEQYVLTMETTTKKE